MLNILYIGCNSFQSVKKMREEKNSCFKEKKKQNNNSAVLLNRMNGNVKTHVREWIEVKWS